MKPLWLAFVSLLLWASSAQAATLISESGFEGANPGADGWLYTASSCTGSPCAFLDVSTDLAHAGSKSLKLSYTESANIEATIRVGLFHTFASSTDVWKRYWYRTSGFTYGVTGTKHFYTEGESPYFFSVNLFSSREISFIAQRWADCGTNGYGNCHLSPNVASRPLADNRWYCIEEHTKLNTPGQANGTAEIFVDGTLTVGYYNRTILGPNVSNPNGNSSLHTLKDIKFYKEQGNGSMYYDQVVVATTRVGCGGTPPPTTDTTSPTAPTNLVVQ